MPTPATVTNPQGVIPTTPLAAFVKLVGVMVGPAARDDRVAVVLKVLAVAVTTMFPAVEPAVTLV
jgi:hypothetical protein